MPELGPLGTVRGALSNGRPLYVGVRQGDRICRIARKAVSLRRPFGDQARAVDPAPLFQAPLFRPDGVLGRVVVAQIMCTRSIDAGPSLEGIEERV